MKVIDLLNKIADGEKVPKKIKYEDEYFVFNEEWHTYVCCDHDLTPLFSQFNMLKFKFLNEEVEILEDTIKEIDEIKELDLSDLANVYQTNNPIDIRIVNKINELVRTANKIQEIINIDFLKK